MRAVRESTYVNTINLTDRVTMDFVWYPGEAAPSVANSYVNTLIAAPGPNGAERTIEYTWARTGHPTVSRTMLSRRITVPLPPGGTGLLTVFGTSWQITRAALGAAMTGSATVRGIQERLNILGYHLRTPGQQPSGVDGVAGRITEAAAVAFQVDYRPQAAAAAPANNRLKVRGEWVTNPNIVPNLSWYNQSANWAAATVNPSNTDGAALQAALVAAVGA
jgi:hypothetical protein